MKCCCLIVRVLVVSLFLCYSINSVSAIINEDEEVTTTNPDDAEETTEEPIGSDEKLKLVVQTSTGKIEGKIVNNKYCKFSKVWYGIPYAKPPVGALRFKPPQPIEPWNKTLKAFRQPNACYQRTFAYSGNDLLEIVNGRMSEDCLYLNIISPARDCNTKLPVFIWFPMDGLSQGSVSMPVYNFQSFSALADAIVVTINYRMSGLGFLRIDDDTAAGNMGLLDQQLAMKWIHENIDQFGGDPNTITLFGHTDGGVFVGLHLVSPGSQGLFNNVIMMSGVPNDLWAYETQAESLAKAQALGFSLGCPILNNTELYECLQTKDPFDIVSEGVDSLFAAYLPTIDGVFVSDTFNNLLESQNFTNLSIIIGNTVNEGNSYALLTLQDEFNVPMEQLPGAVNESMAVSVISNFLTASGYDPSLAQDVYNLYATESANAFKVLANYFADAGMNCLINDLAKRLTMKGVKVYKYVFNHTSECSSWANYTGIARGEDIFYAIGTLFECCPSIKFSEDEKEMSLAMLWFFSKFSRWGNPTDIWTPYSVDNQTYLSLNIDGPLMQTDFRDNECANLKSIFAGFNLW